MYFIYNDFYQHNYINIIVKLTKKKILKCNVIKDEKTKKKKLNKNLNK